MISQGATSQVQTGISEEQTLLVPKCAMPSLTYRIWTAAFSILQTAQVIVVQGTSGVKVAEEHANANMMVQCFHASAASRIVFTAQI